MLKDSGQEATFECEMPRPATTNSSKSHQGRRRGRPPKDPNSRFARTSTIRLILSEALLTEIDNYRPFAAKRRYKDISKSEAIRDLLIFGLRFWRKKYVDNDRDQSSGPSLF